MATHEVSRNTRQRAAVLEALRSSGVFQSAQQLHAGLRRKGMGVGLATVYRTLQMLTDARVVDTIRARDEVKFRLCGRSEHHHHLVCVGCGTSVEIADDKIERWAAQTAAKHGFTHDTHDLEIYGRCRDCSL